MPMVQSIKMRLTQLIKMPMPHAKYCSFNITCAGGGAEGGRTKQTQTYLGF